MSFSFALAARDSETAAHAGVIENSRRAAYGYDQRAEILGELGSVSIDNDPVSTAVISTVDGVSTEKPLHFFLERYAAAYRLEFAHFVSAVPTGTPITPDIVDGLRAQMLADAAAESLATGRPITIG